MIFGTAKNGSQRQWKRSANDSVDHTASTVGDQAYALIDGESWFQIEDSHLMPEFFTTPVSPDNHWMFVSSNGAVTAGRKDAEHALFPYYSCDKLADMSESSGSLTLIRVQKSDGSFVVWRPFQKAINCDTCSRTVYKNVDGNRIVFEEVNQDLSLIFRYQWSVGKQFGFVRTCEIVNLSAAPVSISILDGLQNLVPAGLSKDFQRDYSNLGDAYKKNELLESTQIGLYYLSSIPTDRGEPNEGLRATVVWHVGLNDVQVLLSTRQLDQFCTTGLVDQERDVRGHRGAYLVHSAFELPALDSTDWQIVADVHQDACDVARLTQQVADPQIQQNLNADVADCQRSLRGIVSSADGRQSGAQQRRTHRHQSNVLYNVMRGGLPANNHEIKLQEFIDYLSARNRKVTGQHRSWLEQLGDSISLQQLIEKIESIGDADLLRLGQEYLPFTFSRRHGDPSRPWNRFSIDLYHEDGSRKLAYEGNWRDIFQNWEAVAFSWPAYTANMIRRFVNASTADGYNPYRITSEGIDWERPSEDAFTNIGYWGDHQIIYLLKLLEWQRQIDPVGCDRMLHETNCTYAHVPYRIADYQKTLKNPAETIEFDEQLDRVIDGQVEALGSDGKLVQSGDGSIYHATMLEKLILPGLVKMTNFVPGGGIWLNTQRPEWNDANNALVGNGMSVVTVCYLRRYFNFLINWFSQVSPDADLKVSAGVSQLVLRVHEVLTSNENLVSRKMSAANRKSIVDALSQAGSDHRQGVYNDGVAEQREAVQLDKCVDLFKRCVAFLDDCIASNRRGDGLFHSYNLLRWEDESIKVDRLSEMLEGQVAVVTSNSLSPEQVCDVLDALRVSQLYRADQESYVLYPDRQLPRFTDKNVIDSDLVNQSELLLTMLRDGDSSIVKRDVSGTVRFHADLRNVDCLHSKLNPWKEKSRYSNLVENDWDLVSSIYEQTFRHHRFTGRSENFFAYEGLGSIYWHMVSKLALATLEQYVDATGPDAKDVSTAVIQRLQQHYISVREGLGVNKTPAHFGAFPTDPYSHTPAHAGAQQPGMTGQVKEDVLCRMLEIGARVRSGRVTFEPSLFGPDEFHSHADCFEFIALDGSDQRLELIEGQFAWTWCQVPIVYHRSEEDGLELHFTDGETISRGKLQLTVAETVRLFSRDESISRIDVRFNPSKWAGGKA